jgi:hypothetical protein
MRFGIVAPATPAPRPPTEDQHRYGDHDQISRAADHRAVPCANGISLPPNGII